MIPRWVYPAALAVCIIGGLYFRSCYQENREQAAIELANVAKGEADALKRQATALLETEKADKAHIALADATVETLRRRLADIQNRRPDASAPASATPEPSHTVIAPGTPGEWATLLALVEAQDAQVKTRDALILTVTASRDWWKDAEGARSREAAGLRIALEAQKSLTKSALWVGRFQGLAVGFGAGYLIRGNR